MTEAFTHARMQRIAGAVVVAVVIAGVLGVLRDGVHGLYGPNGVVLGGDFFAFYGAGDAVATGQAHTLYEPSAAVQRQHALVGPSPRARFPLFFSPPVVALFFSGFARLPYVPALLCWWAISLMALGLAFRTTLQTFGVAKSTGAMAFWAATFLPLLNSLWLGQMTALLLALFAGTLAAARNNKDIQAGVMAGVLTLKPQLGIGLAIFFLVNRRWKTVLAASITAGLLHGLTALLLPDASTAFLESLPFISKVVRGEYYTFPAFLAMSVPGAVHLSLPDGALGPYADLASLVICLVMIVLALPLARVRPWDTKSSTWVRSLAATLAIGWLASPHLLYYDLALFLLPAALVWSLPDKDRQGGVTGCSLASWTVAAWFGASLSSMTAQNTLSLLRFVGLDYFAIQWGTAILVIWGLILGGRNTNRILPLRVIFSSSFVAAAAGFLLLMPAAFPIPPSDYVAVGEVPIVRGNTVNRFQFESDVEEVVLGLLTAETPNAERWECLLLGKASCASSTPATLAWSAETGPTERISGGDPAKITKLGANTYLVSRIALAAGGPTELTVTMQGPAEFFELAGPRVAILLRAEDAPKYVAMKGLGQQLILACAILLLVLGGAGLFRRARWPG